MKAIPAKLEIETEDSEYNQKYSNYFRLEYKYFQGINLWGIKHKMVKYPFFQIQVSKHFDGKEYRVESFEHWKDYIKEYQLIQSPNLMVEVIECNKEKIMPRFLVKSICN